MAVIIACIENHRDPEIDLLCRKYLQRLDKMHPVKLELLPAAKVREPENQKLKESETIEKLCRNNDTLILCDERGKNFTSEAFASYLQNELNHARGNLILAIGGSYGFSQNLLKKYAAIRLSDMTMPHHLARVVLVEQVYRAFTILKGTGYHH